MRWSRTVGMLGMLGLLLLHSFSLTAVWAEFKWRQAVLERTLCENRDRPELGCHAHCILKKRLQAAEATNGPVEVKPGLLADLFLPPAPLQLAPPLEWPALLGAPTTRPGPGAYDCYEAALLQPPDAAGFIS